MTPTTLLAIHGMAGLGSLWNDVTKAWDGPTLSPDLAGHGRAPRLEAYRPETFADELVERLSLSADSGSLVIAGHSLGGVVALELARRHTDLDLRRLVLIGIKTTWTEDDVAGAHGLADKGVRWFEDEQAARERFVRSTGVTARIEPTDERVADGVVSGPGGWRTATDPEAYRVGAMNFQDLFDAVPCPITLARGAQDAMVPADDLGSFGHAVIEIPDAGHNAHVDNAPAVAALIEDTRS